MIFNSLTVIFILVSSGSLCNVLLSRLRGTDNGFLESSVIVNHLSFFSSYGSKNGGCFNKNARCRKFSRQLNPTMGYQGTQSDYPD